MIIYGSKAVHLKSKTLKTTTCSSCGSKGTLILSVFRRHAHIFWIPLFPIGKKGISTCQHCKNVLHYKEMSETHKKEFDHLKNKVKGPIWQFAGLGLVATLIILGSYINFKDEKLALEYISTPMKGDVYEYKIELNSYSTLKVVRLSNDSVFVSPNQFEISRISKIPKIDIPENYSKLTYGISKTELKAMFDSGEVFGVNR